MRFVIPACIAAFFFHVKSTAENFQSSFVVVVHPLDIACANYDTITVMCVVAFSCIFQIFQFLYFCESSFLLCIHTECTPDSYPTIVICVSRNLSG